MDIKLTSNEFLSIYTGRIIGESFDVVTNALGKLYNVNGAEIGPATATCLAQNFRAYIQENRKDLAEAVKEIESLKYDRKRDKNTQINEYVKNFEKIIGKNTITISKTLDNSSDLTF